MNYKFILLLLFLFFSNLSFAQSTNQNLDDIKKDLDNFNFKSAKTKLENWYKTDKNNPSVTWLYAYTLSQMADYKQSKLFYERTLVLLPISNELIFEYAQTLLKMGKLNDALIEIQKLKNTDFDQSQVLLTEAEINFWSGKYTQSKATLANFDSLFPNNSITNELKKKIEEAKLTNISIEGNYIDDNQPLKAIGEKIEISKMQSNWLFPALEIKNSNYSNDSQDMEASISNQFLLANIGLTTKLKLGLQYSDITKNQNVTGGLYVHKKLSKNAMLNLDLQHLVYKSTLESTLLDFTYNKATFGLNFGDLNKSLLHVEYNFTQFEDENTIQNFGLWYISKPLFKSDLKVQLGYGFGYSDAAKSTYTPTITEYGSFFNTTSTLVSKYEIYYTPNNQIVNSTVLVANYPISKKLEMNAKVNYGFYATAQNPSYTLSNGNNPTPIYQENKTKFNPFDSALSLDYKLSKYWVFSVQTSYFKTYFYDSFNGGIKLKFQL